MCTKPSTVMAGLVPAAHDLRVDQIPFGSAAATPLSAVFVGGRDKPGHDVWEWEA
jgi:hypothetical protein